jgi:hypothetical protein
MGMLLWNMKSHLFRNGHENILHNIMWNCPLPTMHTTKKLDPYKIQKIVINAMWHPED